ncbi:MAG: SDR family oxidoreductase [Pseudomonadota bacterium]
MLAAMQDLSSKTVLVTGASSGIGAKIAARLHEHGATVLMAGRDEEKLKDKASAIGIASTNIIACDIANDLDGFRSALSDIPTPNVLINSAGMARNVPFLNVNEDAYDDVFGINVRAVFFVTRALVSEWLAKDINGIVLTISSQMGHVGGPNRSVYCASKHAVEGMMKALTVEFASKGLRFLTLCPTFVDTPLARQTLSDPDMRAWVDASIPAGRLVTTSEVADTAAFLVSDSAAMITGSAVMLDGGWTAA